MAKQLEPLYDRVVIKPLVRASKSGLILVQTDLNNLQEGEISAVGTGRVMLDGSLAKLECNIGDIVLYDPRAGITVSGKGEKLIVLREIEVICKITGEEDPEPEKSGEDTVLIYDTEIKKEDIPV